MGKRTVVWIESSMFYRSLPPPLCCPFSQDTRTEPENKYHVVNCGGNTDGIFLITGVGKFAAINFYRIPFQMRVSRAMVDAIKTKGGDNTSYIFGQTSDILCKLVMTERLKQYWDNVSFVLLRFVIGPQNVSFLLDQSDARVQNLITCVSCAFIS